MATETIGCKGGRPTEGRILLGRRQGGDARAEARQPTAAAREPIVEDLQPLRAFTKSLPPLFSHKEPQRLLEELSPPLPDLQRGEEEEGRVALIRMLSIMDGLGQGLHALRPLAEHYNLLFRSNQCP